MSVFLDYYSYLVSIGFPVYCFLFYMRKNIRLNIISEKKNSIFSIYKLKWSMFPRLDYGRTYESHLIDQKVQLLVKKDLIDEKLESINVILKDMFDADQCLTEDDFTIINEEQVIPHTDDDILKDLMTTEDDKKYEPNTYSDDSSVEEKSRHKVNLSRKRIYYGSVGLPELYDSSYESSDEGYYDEYSVTSREGSSPSDDTKDSVTSEGLTSDESTNEEDVVYW